jgi:hypothetical protein
MPRHITPDGQVFDGPQECVDALRTLEAHAAASAPEFQRMFQPGDRGAPAAFERARVALAQMPDTSVGHLAPLAAPLDRPKDSPRADQSWGAWRT